MTQDKRLAELLPYVGRECVYIESGVFSIARVAAVSASDEGMEAIMEAVPALTLVCHYLETPKRFAEEPHPLGSRWEIGKVWQYFYLDEEFWATI